MTRTSTPRYLEGVQTLSYDPAACTGCRMCVEVCPSGVFEMDGDRANVRDAGACIECGACRLNCAFGAIDLRPGVGCASAIMKSWITGGEPDCDC